MKRDLQYQEEVQEHLQWHEQKRLEYLRDKQAKQQGGMTWSPPELTLEQKEELDAYIKLHGCPF